MIECVANEIRDFFVSIIGCPWNRVASVEMDWEKFDDTYNYKSTIKPRIKITFFETKGD